MVTLLVGIASTGIVVLAAGLGWIVKVLFGIRKDMGREFKEVRSDMHAMETRLSGRVGAVETRIGALEMRVGALEMRVGAVETRVGSVESGLAVLAERIDERTRALRALVEDRTRETHARMDRVELRIDPVGRRAESHETAERVPV